MYSVYQILVSDKELIEAFEEWSFTAHSLYNEALYTIRNLFTGLSKDENTITDNEKELISNVFDAIDKFKRKDIITAEKSLPSYPLLVCYLSKYVKSENYFSSLPRHTAQHTIKGARNDFSNLLKALKAYGENPESFTGKPKMLRYKKNGSSFKFSNQEAIIYKTKFSYELKLPKLKTRIPLGMDFKDKRLKEVTVTKYYGKYMLNLILEDVDFKMGEKEKEIKAAIDFGVDNIIAISTNKGDSLLVKGGAIKSKNQWFNKLIAKNHRGQTVGTTRKAKSSKALQGIYKNRNAFLKDYMHKISKAVISWCLENDVGVLVIGKNKLWKQNINLGGKNNQNFVQIPYYILTSYLEYKANRVGIEAVFQEESYTSKASFLDGDAIPVYRENFTPLFSGQRFERGLYKTKNGLVVNADINGALNILRKKYPEEIFELNNLGYLEKPEVLKII